MIQRLSLLALLAAVTLTGCSPDVPGTEGLEQITIVLFEGADRELVEDIAEGVQGVYGVPVSVADGEPLPLPTEALDETRGQYLAATLRDGLPAPADEHDRTLGLTEADLYARKLNFVFGQAQLPGDRAVMSLARLRPEFWGHNEPDRDLLLERAVKIAVHELGHTFGLRHCDTPGCIMQFANVLLQLDQTNLEFCSDCHAKLGR